MLVDSEHCIGCGYCVQACPYGSRFINRRPTPPTSARCAITASRRGSTTACVEYLPGRARGGSVTAEDPDDPVHEILATQRVQVLQPELLTRPQCYYLGLDMEVR